MVTGCGLPPSAPLEDFVTLRALALYRATQPCADLNSPDRCATAQVKNYAAGVAARTGHEYRTSRTSRISEAREVSCGSVEPWRWFLFRRPWRWLVLCWRWWS